MAEESKIVNNEEVYVDSTDRGLFDFMGKKEEKPTQEDVFVSELEKVHVSEPEEPKVEEEEKKEGIMEKLHRSSSTSSISSSDEEEVEGEKMLSTKGFKEELIEKISEISGEPKTEEKDTSVPLDEPAAPEEKKGMSEKIKENLPGQHTNPEEVPPPAPVLEYTGEGEDKTEKKGFMEKVKEKLPGQHTNPEEVPLPVSVSESTEEGEDKAEKKGILEKIKEKLPGYHAKSEEGKEK